MQGSSWLTSKQLGDFYEQQACHYLSQCGLLLIDQNAHFKTGEIDLIMRDGDCIVFVEVKFRRHTQFGGAASAITTAQQQRLLKTAYLWLDQHNYSSSNTEFRFDAVFFEADVNSISWVKNILIEG